MCYNVAFIHKKIQQQEKRFKASYGIDVDPLPDMYFVNAFQKPDLPVITTEEPSIIQLLQWGLVPHWAKEKKQVEEIQRKTPNARSESVFSKPSFRHAAQNGQRCIVLINGFYEYHHEKDGSKTPYFIRMKDNEVFALAGLYDTWTGENGKSETTVSILTTQANERMGQIHNNPAVLKRGGPRMPVILEKSTELDWLNENITDEKDAQRFFRPLSEDLLEDYAVPQLQGKNGVGNSPKAMKPASQNGGNLEIPFN